MPKMKAAATRSTIPKLPAVYKRNETNAFLKKEKAGILKKFNFQYRSVFRQRDFAICLIALGRTADALQILSYAHTNVRFHGKFDAWYAAGSACCVANYLRRKKGQYDRATKDFQRFIEPPFHAIVFQTHIWTAAFIRQQIAEERERFAPEFDSPNADAAMEARAWWIDTLMVFRELAYHGFPRIGKVPVARLDNWIERALKELAARLHREAMRS